MSLTRRDVWLPVSSPHPAPSTEAVLEYRNRLELLRKLLPPGSSCMEEELQVEEAAVTVVTS